MTGSRMPNIAAFRATDDYTHQADGDPSFQESALFVWNDLNVGVGGFWRLGQEPVRGALNSCFGIFTASGTRFRSNVSGAPMRPSDRGRTHMGWGSQLRVDLDTLKIGVNFPDCQASLRFEDFFPRYDWFALVNHPGAPAHHFEVAGRMTGSLKIGDLALEIDALGYRDRSWGPRQWVGLRGTRWWPCVFGPDLCVFLMALVYEPAEHGTYGYMIRDGVPQTLGNVDIGVMLDSDAISPRSGVGCFNLARGEQCEIQHQRTDGIVLDVRGYTAIESIGTARWGDRIGMSNLEVCTNPAGGSQPPVLVLGANDRQGLTRRGAPAMSHVVI
jgi:hypothetical protein